MSKDMDSIPTAPACAPEIINVRLDPNHHPVAFGQKVKELMEMGLTEEAAKSEVSNMIWDLELVYEKDRGLFAVEAEVLSLYGVEISSPYSKIPLKIH